MQKKKFPIVLDCGGGFIFDVNNSVDQMENNKNFEIPSHRKISLLKENFFIIYLNRTLTNLIQAEQLDKTSQNRQSKNRNRPALSKIPYVNLLQKRIPIYKDTADSEIDIDKFMKHPDSIEKLTQSIILQYQQVI